jgi:hypothetical protein
LWKALALFTVAATLSVLVFSSFSFAQANYITPQEFGAAGDGRHDDTAAIQAAVNAAGSPSDTVYIPKATYIVSATINITQPVHILGDGPLSSIIKTTASKGDVLSVSANGVKIENLQFLSTVPRTSGSFVNFMPNSSQVTLRDFSMYGAYIGVTDQAGAESRIQSGTIFGGVSTVGSVGIIVNGGNDAYITQVTMDAPVLSQPWAGIQILSTGCVNITDCDIVHHTNDLLINPVNNSVASVYVVNTYFDTAANGIVINPSGNGSVVRCRFTGCWTSSHVNSGVTIRADGSSLIDGIEFIGHHCFVNGLQNSEPGFTVLAGTGKTLNIRVNGGSFSGNGGSGIAISAGITDFSIIGARMGSGFGVAGNAQWGIQVNPGNSNNYVINGNDLRGNTLGGLSDGGTGATKAVTNNLGYNPLGPSPIIVGASPFKWTNNLGFPVVMQVSGGAVYSIWFGGVDIGTSTQSLLIPQGQTVTVAYSSTPQMSCYGLF